MYAHAVKRIPDITSQIIAPMRTCCFLNILESITYAATKYCVLKLSLLNFAPTSLFWVLVTGRASSWHSVMKLKYTLNVTSKPHDFHS